MSQILIASKKRNSSSYSIKGHYYNNGSDACFQIIPGIPSIVVEARMGNQLLITLNVPDTWCDKAGDGAWFAISVNDKIVGRGVYYCGKDGQRVPITIQAVVDVTSNLRYSVKAMWCNEAGTEDRNCYIGQYSETTLTVLQLD